MAEWRDDKNRRCVGLWIEPTPEPVEVEETPIVVEVVEPMVTTPIPKPNPTPVKRKGGRPSKKK